MRYHELAIGDIFSIVTVSGQIQGLYLKTGGGNSIIIRQPLTHGLEWSRYVGQSMFLTRIEEVVKLSRLSEPFPNMIIVDDAAETEARASMVMSQDFYDQEETTQCQTS